uniref:Regulatory protein-modification, helix-turn-helix, transcriptional regulato, DNA n=1 Tax=Siphoviridae sp. ct3pR10 TaxID=2826284 RepID=A0A8S5LWT9_9CAUD|nr:MAG TPA: Regulatory protein-modification, helix-turn-helix, transcriptional regulato, DNA [Siphoviridae sp. ct3pR10]
MLIPEVNDMTSKEIVSKIMKDQGVTNAELAAKLDLTQATLWDRLNPKKTNNMTVKKLGEMLKMLDYKVVVVPRKSRIPEGGYEVE